MQVFQRRKLVKSLLFSPLLLYFNGKTSIAGEVTDKRAAIADLDAEVIRTYIAWEKNFSQKPIEFLNSKNLGYPLSAKDMSNHRENDFANGKTLEVEGLVISKTEAALIITLFLDSI